jgi:hypothetical protein
VERKRIFHLPTRTWNCSIEINSKTRRAFPSHAKAQVSLLERYRFNQRICTMSCQTPRLCSPPIIPGAVCATYSTQWAQWAQWASAEATTPPLSFVIKEIAGRPAIEGFPSVGAYLSDIKHSVMLNAVHMEAACPSATQTSHRPCSSPCVVYCTELLTARLLETGEMVPTSVPVQEASRTYISCKIDR